MMGLACKLSARIGVVIFTSVLFSFCLLQGCAGTKANQAGERVRDLQAFCMGNAFIRKYNCSLDQIQVLATQGNPDAEYALGYLYYYGIGTEADENSAMIWINKAAAQGQPLATRAVKAIHRAEFPKLGSIEVKGRDISSIKISQSQVSGPSMKGRGGERHLAQKDVRHLAQKDVRHPAVSTNKQNLDRYAHKIKNAKSMTQVKPVVKSSSSRSSLVATKKAIPGLQKNKKPQWTRCDVNKIANLPVSINSLALGSRGRYMLQLAASHSLVGVQTFVKANSLPGVRIYKTQLKMKPWYIAAYGLFSNRREALAARDCLQRVVAVGLRKVYARAWPKPLHGVLMAAHPMSPNKVSS